MGFWRALKGELFALLKRRSTLAAILVTLAAALVGVVHGYIKYVVLDDSDSSELGAHGNYWPRYGQAVHWGLLVTELLTVIMVGGLLAREIQSGAARDPLTRRISRPGFFLARCVAAMAFPVILTGLNISFSSSVSSMLFPKGHVITDPVILMEDPEAEQGYQDWLVDNDLRSDQVAAWFDKVSNGTEGDQAAEELGLKPIQLPEQFEAFVPYLVFYEEDIRSGIKSALLQALPSLMVLGLFACCISVLVPSVVIAAGLAAILGFLLAKFIPEGIGDYGAWIFADWLPGMGMDSQLAKARLVAEGYSDVPQTEPATLQAGLVATAIEGVVFVLLGLLLFRKKPL